ncbi:hypothetical protein M0802_007642 [Mischocyttarus mexicanus]|nr:hypothetical protein M0802_007642 [Mischocyttarus mexicanus]
MCSACYAEVARRRWNISGAVRKRKKGRVIKKELMEQPSRGRKGEMRREKSFKGRGGRWAWVGRGEWLLLIGVDVKNGIEGKKKQILSVRGDILA